MLKELNHFYVQQSLQKKGKGQKGPFQHSSEKRMSLTSFYRRIWNMADHLPTTAFPPFLPHFFTVFLTEGLSNKLSYHAG